MTILYWSIIVFPFLDDLLCDLLMINDLYHGGLLHLSIYTQHDAINRKNCFIRVIQNAFTNAMPTITNIKHNTYYFLGWQQLRG